MEKLLHLIPPALFALACLVGCTTQGTSSGGPPQRHGSTKESVSGAKTVVDVDKLLSESERAIERRN